MIMSLVAVSLVAVVMTFVMRAMGVLSVADHAEAVVLVATALALHLVTHGFDLVGDNATPLAENRHLLAELHWCILGYARCKDQEIGFLILDDANYDVMDEDGFLLDGVE